MKSLRLWLLILVAVLLPLRGALAVGLACSSEPAATHAGVGAGHVHRHAGPGRAHHLHAGDADHGSTHQHAAQESPQEAAHGSGHDAAGDTAGTCSLCAACCSATAPQSVTLALPQAPPGAAALPEPRARTAEFFSGGPERPPRSI